MLDEEINSADLSRVRALLRRVEALSRRPPRERRREVTDELVLAMGREGAQSPAAERLRVWLAVEKRARLVEEEVQREVDSQMERKRGRRGDELLRRPRDLFQRLDKLKREVMELKAEPTSSSEASVEVASRRPLTLAKKSLPKKDGKTVARPQTFKSKTDLKACQARNVVIHAEHVPRADKAKAKAKSLSGHVLAGVDIPPHNAGREHVKEFVHVEKEEAAATEKGREEAETKENNSEKAVDAETEKEEKLIESESSARTEGRSDVFFSQVDEHEEHIGQVEQDRDVGKCQQDQQTHDSQEDQEEDVPEVPKLIEYEDTLTEETAWPSPQKAPVEETDEETSAGSAEDLSSNAIQPPSLTALRRAILEELKLEGDEEEVEGRVEASLEDDVLSTIHEVNEVTEESEEATLAPESTGQEASEDEPEVGGNPSPDDSTPIVEASALEEREISTPTPIPTPTPTPTPKSIPAPRHLETCDADVQTSLISVQARDYSQISTSNSFQIEALSDGEVVFEGLSAGEVRRDGDNEADLAPDVDVKSDGEI